MKKIILILFSVIEIASCRNEKPSILRSNGLVVLDSLKEKGISLSYEHDERMAYFPVYYNGRIKDTILLGKSPLPRYSGEYDEVKYDTHFSIKDLTIFVDTNLKMVHQLIFYIEFDNEGKRIVDSISSINAFGFIIKNNGNLNAHLGIMASICSMFRQAKNDDDEWIDIETPTYYYCGTGASQVIIQSKGMILAKVMRFKGDIIKECRLKLKLGKDSIYSNVFIDSLDSRQLTDSLKQIRF